MASVRRGSIHDWMLVAAALFFAGTACRHADAPETTSLGEDLLTVAAARPALRVRLSGFSPFAKHSQPRRERDSGDAASRLIFARRSDQPADLDAAAQFAILTGQPNVALALLKKAQTTATSAEVLSDLAATYLILADEDQADRIQLLVRAVDAASSATRLQPTLAAAWTNLATGLDALGLRQPAAEMRVRAATLDNPATRAPVQPAVRTGPTPTRPAWSDARSQLLDLSAPMSADTARVARTFPQPVRELIEDELLPAWGASYLARSPQADSRWSRARTLVREHAGITRDPLLLETVDAIDRAQPSVRDLCAEGFVEFGEGRAAYERNQFEMAGRRFHRAAALLRRAGTPFFDVANYQASIVDYQTRRLNRAAVRLTDTIHRASQRGFQAVAARAELLLGMVRLQSEDVEGALAWYASADRRFRTLGESENVVNAANSAADTLRLIGQHDAGWAEIGRALAGVSELRSARRRYVILLNASLYAAEENLPSAALLFQDASIAAARERGVANTLAEGFTRRAMLYLKAGDAAGAARDLEEAQIHVARIPSPASQRYQQAWLDAARGKYLNGVNPRAALGAFTSALEYFDRGEPAEVPRIYLHQSRAYAALAQQEAAEHSLLEGVARFERRWGALDAGTHRISYLDEDWDLFDDLADFYAVTRHRPDRAFRYCEAWRARSLRDPAASATTATPDLVRRAIDAKSAVVYYAALKQHLLTWTITSTGVRFHVNQISAVDLTSLVTAYRHMIEAGETAAEIRSVATRLYRQVVRDALDRVPAGWTVVLVPDGPLHALPFATLIDPDSGLYLIQKHPLTLSPSAGEFLRSAMRLGRLPGGPPHLAAVGNTRPSPAFRLPSLPDAAAELREVASLYPHAAMLVDDRATPEAFRLAAQRASIIHFAGHARVNLRFPELSQLILSPAPESHNGVLTSQAIARWKLERTDLVVLGGCGTATGAAYRGEGVMSLARPFLRAGVPSVVGTLWDVDDRSARALLRTFHERYRTEADPVFALRRAQLQFIESTDPQLQPVAAWGPFVVISGTRPAR